MSSKDVNGVISQSTSKVGFVGLGNLGAPMAIRLIQEGWQVIVFDRAPAKAASCAEAGGAVAESLDEVMDADVLVLVVPDDEAVQAVLEGPDGYFTRGGDERVVVVHSTILPATAQRLAREAAQHGIALLDAPVSGGAERALAGDLTIILGAEDEPAARVEPLLRSVGTTIDRVGAAGAGAAVKLANQLMLFATLGGVHEALALTRAHGVDDEAVLQAVATSTGSSWVTQNWGFFDRTAHSYSQGGTIVRDRPWSKDLFEVLAAGRVADLDLPVTAVLSQTVARYVEEHAREAEQS